MKTIYLLTACLITSLFFNYVAKQSESNSKLPTMRSSVIERHDVLYVKANGCLLREDRKENSKNVRQYFQITAEVSKTSKNCIIIDSIESKTVIIGDPESCEVESVNVDRGSATVKHKGISFVISNEKVLFSSLNKKDNGKFTDCLHPLLNRELFD